MVEKKETSCWMRRDNNALVLFPNLKKISFKLERKHENHLWVEERSFWKEEVKSCHASSEEERNAKSNQGIHVSCRTSVLTWDLRLEKENAKPDEGIQFCNRISVLTSTIPQEIGKQE